MPVARVRRTALGDTKIQVAAGRTYVFAHTPRADRKFLRMAVEEMQARVSPKEAFFPDIVDLCAHCYRIVSGRPRSCPHCEGAFKEARRAGLLSLLSPGLGDLYLGHTRFGVFEILVAALIWLGYLVPDPTLPRTTTELFIGAVVGPVLVLVHGVDGVATWYIGRKGLYPAGS